MSFVLVCYNSDSRNKGPGLKSYRLTFFKSIFRSTQRDGMGREDGGGFRMGNTCIPVADSF